MANTIIKYNNTQIAEVAPGETTILDTKDKWLSSRIEIESGGNTTVKYNGSTIAKIASGETTILDTLNKWVSNRIEITYSALQPFPISSDPQFECYIEIDEASVGKNINIVNPDWYGMDFSGNILINGVSYPATDLKGHIFNAPGKYLIIIPANAITNYTGMFSNSESLTTYRAANLETLLSPLALEGMFEGCKNLKQVDLSAFSTLSGITSLKNMFKGCESILEIDLSSLDMSNIKNLYSVFEGCSNLSAVKLNHNSTRELTSIEKIVHNCPKLCHVDFSTLLIDSSTGLGYAIDDCISKDFVWSEDIDFMVILTLECDDGSAEDPSIGYGYKYYDPSVTGSIGCVKSCPSNAKLYYNQCAYTQPENTILVGNEYKDCPIGTHAENNECVPDY